jgi:adenylate cyclase
VHTFLFADLAGFTALTEAMGDEEAADLAAGFCSAVRELFPARGAEEVKAIGDALMVRLDDAGEAVRLGSADRQRDRRPTFLPDRSCRNAHGPRLNHGGMDHHFCSLTCAARFAAAPERYVA